MNHISVTGSHVPKLILEFDELRTSYQVPENLLNNMKSSGYVYPTPIQMQAMPVLLEVCKFLITSNIIYIFGKYCIGFFSC